MQASTQGEARRYKESNTLFTNDIREGLLMIQETQITQLEKRARGFRRIISALNDLPMYGINRHLDKILHE